MPFFDDDDDDKKLFSLYAAQLSMTFGQLTAIKERNCIQINTKIKDGKHNEIRVSLCLVKELGEEPGLHGSP